jgi:hypothetical protein
MSQILSLNALVLVSLLLVELLVSKELSAVGSRELAE